MKRIGLIVMILGCTGVAARAQTLTPELFNGKNFDGWRVNA